MEMIENQPRSESSEAERFADEMLMEQLLTELIDGFDDPIREKGTEDYHCGALCSIVRSGNVFYTKVKESGLHKIRIAFDLINDEVHYSCDCSLPHPCRHIYAALIAIKNGEYSEEKLMPFIKRKKISLEEMIRAIPADELKDYLLSAWGKEYVCVEENHFNDVFSAYLPKQSYDYYYNNFYNSLILDGYETPLLNSYLSELRTHLLKQDYTSALAIIKAIIEAAHNLDHLNRWDALIEAFPSIATALRIVARKCDESTQSELNDWLDHLTACADYNSVYLEDMRLEIR